MVRLLKGKGSIEEIPDREESLNGVDHRNDSTYFLLFMTDCLSFTFLFNQLTILSSERS